MTYRALYTEVRYKKGPRETKTFFIPGEEEFSENKGVKDIGVISELP